MLCTAAKQHRCLLRIGNSTPNPRRHNTPCTHSRQVLLWANPHQPLTSGQRPLLFGHRRDLISGTSRKCTMHAIRNWQLTPLAAPRQCLIHTNPRSAAPNTSPNSAAPVDKPRSALAVGVDTPQTAALDNYQLRVSRACQWPRSQSRRKLKLKQ